MCVIFLKAKVVVDDLRIVEHVWSRIKETYDVFRHTIFFTIACFLRELIQAKVVVDNLRIVVTACFFAKIV